MSTPAPLDMRAELARLRENDLRDRFSLFPARMLTWLAALPAWTAELASQLGLSPSAESAAVLVGELQAADLIETKLILRSGGKTAESFWLRASVRQDLGRYLQQTSGARLDQDLSELGNAVAALALEPAVAGSLGSGDWVKILRQYQPDPSGIRLIADVDHLIAAGRLAAATALIAAARSLGELASRPLLDAARRAQWRVDRASRLEQDHEQLRHYCGRAEVELAIEDLLLDPGQTWALHLLGDGGVGKTMLVRYLATGRFAEDRSQVPPFLVARADFDHLDPRYPEQRPAELLLALAAELAAFTGTRDLYRLYRRFQDAADVLHEVRSRPDSGPSRGPDPLREAAARFAQFVNQLGAPVLLVLDTCEELAKLYTPGASAPAIDETFRLLELVRERAPSLRVLLAGRRWLVPSGDERRQASGPLLRSRPYLRVLPVAGFSRAEAEAYVDTRERMRREEDGDAEPFRPDLRTALLERSARRSGGQDVYSPFELAAYCDWAASDTDLDPERLRAAPGDPYVEWRIIGRLNDTQVRGALGVAAELGRFDLKLVTPALSRAGLDAAAAFAGLAAQEWVNVLTLGPDGRPRVIEVDEHLLARIRRVTARSPAQFVLDRPRLGQDAVAVIDRTPLGDLPAETVEAAVRLLPAGSAAALWQRIEERASADRTWGWVAQVATRVGAVELARAEQAGAGSPTILAAIIATQAAARLHNWPSRDVSRLWHEVERLASRHPDEDGRAVLRLRARLGRLAAGEPGDGANAVLLEALRARPAVRDALTGAVVAAVEGCLARGTAPGDDVPALLEGLASAAAPSMAQAGIYLSRAVLSFWAGESDAAVAEADRAAEAAEAAVPPAGGRGRQWADWDPPARLADRCRLVRLIIAWRRGEAVDAVPWEAWQREALKFAADIDAERLIAMTVRFERGHQLVAAEQLLGVQAAERYVSSRRPSSWAHFQVAPLVVELAQAWRVLGEPGRGSELLHEHLEAAVAAGDDPDTIDACQLALLRLCRRQRTPEYFSSVHRLSADGATRLRHEAWVVRTLVTGQQPKDPEAAGSWSTWWQCQDSDSLARLDGPPSGPPPTAPGTERAEFAEFFPAVGKVAADDGGAAAAAGDFDPEAELRLGRELTLPPGARGRAAVAVAELTALRFPERGERQLLAAARLLRAAGDELGAQEATVLAGLAAARGRRRQAARAAWDDLSATGAARTAGEILSGWPGWRRRAAALRGQVNRQAWRRATTSSPELRLPVTRRQRIALALGSVTFWTWVTTVIAGVTVLADVGTAFAFLAKGTHLPWFPRFSTGTAAWLPPLALTLSLFAATFLTGRRTPSLGVRFIATRAIRVRRNGAGRVSAEAVPWRGLRDLGGLSPEVLAGVIIGRWPFWSMFFPWRGRWTAEARPASVPRFDLDGLELPDRALSVIQLRADDDSLWLPWEQWLGGAAPAGRLLWFRQVPGRPPARYRVARGQPEAAAYLGPRHLVAGRPGWPPDDEAVPLHLLHIVATPVETRAGWRLRLAEAQAGLARTPSRGVTAGEELLDVDQFPLDRTALAVLQADPVDGLPRPLGDLRSAFMGCARDLLGGGAGAVLVVPPAPDRIGREVVEATWDVVGCRREPPTPSALLNLLARVQGIVAGGEPDESERPELDVLLFMRTPAGG